MTFDEKNPEVQSLLNLMVRKMEDAQVTPDTAADHVFKLGRRQQKILSTKFTRFKGVEIEITNQPDAVRLVKAAPRDDL